MISCVECRNIVHKYCIFAPAQTSSQGSFIFKCDDCLKCHNCEAIIEDENFIKPSQDSDHSNMKICEDCAPLYHAKQFCPVCLKAHTCKIKNSKAKKFIKDLFSCDCGLWIHENCDSLLRRNPVNLNKARSKEFCYNCPQCRVDHKKIQTIMFIQILMKLDVNTLFTEEIDRANAFYYKTIKQPIFLSYMLEYANKRHYVVDSVKKIKSDLDLLWKNIHIFNMPNTSEFLEGYKFMKLAYCAFSYFEQQLSKSVDEYLFDNNENFILNHFYEFKNYLIREYLNVIAQDYESTSRLNISCRFEEKDKRSVSSKERNKINHQLSSKKMKYLCIEDLYEFEKFEFDLESKSMVVEVSGINMLKMDYSEVDFSMASHSLKTFLKNNASVTKKSLTKSGLDLIGQNGHPAIEKINGLQASSDEEEEKLLSPLAQADFELICQLEYWLSEHRDTIDYNFILSMDMQPISFKVTNPESALKPACLVSG